MPMGTVSRAVAQSEHGCVVRLYRASKDRLLRYAELYEEVDAEGAALPADQWRDGYWDAAEYIVEACDVGIYKRLEVLATMVTRYTNDTSVWTYEQMRAEVLRCPGAVHKLRWRRFAPWYRATVPRM